MPETTVAATYVDAENQMLSASNGVDYAYRATGAADATPLVMLQHFRGNLDNWDPALIDALAARPSGDHLRQPGGRGVEWEDTEHDRADGARRDRLHRCAGSR